MDRLIGLTNMFNNLCDFIINSVDNAVQNSPNPASLPEYYGL